jgi:hypothetical protein
MDENDDMLADSHKILNRSLVSDHSPSEAEIAIAKLKKYKL